MNNLSLQQKVGQKLRELLAENNLTQEEFAEQYGTDVRSVSRYINGAANKLDLVQSLADWFGVSPLEFFK